MTETIFEISLPIHILAGVGALFFAPVAMIVQKGGKAHRFWGWVYYWCMAVVFITTLTMGLHRPSVFLTAVGVLSFYSAFSAQRVLRMKRPDVQPPRWYDWIAAIATILVGVLLVGRGALALLTPDDPLGSFAILSLVFGTLLILNARSDVQRFRNPPSYKQFWWIHHMNLMIGSYIGAVTAFTVQTVSRWMLMVDVLAPWVWLTWILPTAIGMPLAALWTSHYRRKFAARQAQTQVEQQPA